MLNPSKYLGNELEYLERVLNSESWSSTSGSWTKKLEGEFAKKFESKYAVAFNSGTATMHSALEAAGIGAGDEVISPGLTVMMNTTSTLHANAIPVYADVDPNTFNIDPEDIRRKITDKTKAIMVVALYGLPAEMDEIMQIAKEHDLLVIEDNAQCFLSTYKGRLAGTIGHVSSWSFENTKHLSCGEGGMITTNDEMLAEKCRKMGGHGFKNLKAEEGRIRLNQDQFQNPDYKRHDSLGWNYRLPEINAAIALAQLERIEKLVKLRQDSAKIFLEVIDKCDFLQAQHCPEHSTSSYYTLGVVYNGLEKMGVTWADFRKAYVEEGGDGIYSAWSVPYLEPLMVNRAYVARNPSIYENISYQEGLCPVAESLQKKMMQFKTNYRDLELAKVKAAALERAIKRYM